MKKKRKKKEEERKDELNEDEVPSKCPICNKVTNNVLLHIKKKESCNTMIEPQIYEKWKDLANKRKKSKYQKKYIKAGKHDKAQKKYTQKCNKKRQRWLPKTSKADKSKVHNKEKVERGKIK